MKFFGFINSFILLFSILIPAVTSKKINISKIKRTFESI